MTSLPETAATFVGRTAVDLTELEGKLLRWLWISRWTITKTLEGPRGHGDAGQPSAGASRPIGLDNFRLSGKWA